MIAGEPQFVYDFLEPLLVAVLVASGPLAVAIKQLRENRRQHGQVAETVEEAATRIDANHAIVIALQRQLTDVQQSLLDHVEWEMRVKWEQEHPGA